MNGPCDWPESPCEACPAPDDASDAVLGQASQLATFLLWSWTGQRFGICETTIRPCDTAQAVCGCGSGRRRRRCSCGPVSEVLLPGPVHSITSVVVRGETLDPCSYRVDDSRWLVRTDGGRWPACQDMTGAGDGPGGFQVTYMRGIEPPPGTGLAVGELACQLAHAMCGSPGCKLPSNIRRKVRQGVTVEFSPITIESTGIASVDMWLTVANARSKRTRIWSPDIAEPRTTTWTCDDIPDSPSDSPGGG